MESKFNNWITIVNDDFIKSSTNFYNTKCAICGSFYHKTNNRQMSCLNHYFIFKCCTCGKELISKDKHRGELFLNIKIINIFVLIKEMRNILVKIDLVKKILLNTISQKNTD